jgi:3-deoxy-manno-octulosonate cytidylyltransferase (CMP-KDO synthetase)
MADKTVIVIPTRYASKRFPGKALVKINEKPLIQHVYLQAKKVRGVDDVLVATDDERILWSVEGFGGKAVITSTGHRCGTERVAEAAESLQADIVVNLQGDEPLIQPGSIEQLIRAMADKPILPMATLKTRIQHENDLRNPNVVKVVTDRDDFALYFSRSVIPHQGKEPEHHAYKHIGVYAFRRDFLRQFARLEPAGLEKREKLEQLRVLENGFKILVVETEHDSIAVNTLKELEQVAKLMEKKR